MGKIKYNLVVLSDTGNPITNWSVFSQAVPREQEEYFILRSPTVPEFSDELRKRGVNPEVSYFVAKVRHSAHPTLPGPRAGPPSLDASIYVYIQEKGSK